MKKLLLLALMMGMASISSNAQRVIDKLDRGLVAVKTTGGVFVSWRIQSNEYYDVTYNTTEGDAQNLKMWAVQAATSAGAGSASAASVITGRPYILPFHNSFRNASLEDQFLGIYRSSAAYKWYMLDDSYDGDAGCL